jgi:hypothetical protein
LNNTQYEYSSVQTGNDNGEITYEIPTVATLDRHANMTAEYTVPEISYLLPAAARLNSQSAKKTPLPVSTGGAPIYYATTGDRLRRGRCNPWRLSDPAAR